MKRNSFDFAPEFDCKNNSQFNSGLHTYGENPYIAAANDLAPAEGVDAAQISVPNDPSHVLEGTVNRNWYNWTRGNLLYYENPDSIGVPIYEEMYQTDESCFAGVEFVKMAALAKIGRYCNKQPGIENEINEGLANLQGSWLEALDEIMSAIWAGHSATEIVMNYDGKLITPSSLQTLHPHTVSYDIWLDGPKANQLKAVHQRRWGSYQAYLPAEKVIVFSNNKFAGNFYGQSRFRTCWRSWFLKCQMLQSWANVLDRYGAPFAVGTVGDPDAMVPHPDNPKRKIRNFDAVLLALDRMSSRGSTVTDAKTKIELFQAKQAVGVDFAGIIEYCDKMILRGLLIPSLVGDHGKGGSYALGKNHYDLFVLMLENFLAKVLSAVIEQFIKPWIILNHGPQKDYGFFAVEDFQQDDEKVLAEGFLALCNAGILKPGLADDLNYCRERVGMRPLTQAEIDSQPQIVPQPSQKDPAEVAPEGQQTGTPGQSGQPAAKPAAGKPAPPKTGSPKAEIVAHVATYAASLPEQRRRSRRVDWREISDYQEAKRGAA